MKVHLPVRKAILNRRTYEAPAEGRADKLRLDFNENTSGCSPAGRRALARLTTNPNNPTGTLLQKEELRKILKAATHTAVVMDEAYAEFSGFSAIPWIRKYPQLFVARTFSKVAGLAALRLGAVIACKESLALVRRAMPPFPGNLAALVPMEAPISDRPPMQPYRQTAKKLPQ